VEDAWLEAAEGVGVGQGAQGVVLLPSCVVIQFLEVGQVFGQVSNSIVGAPESLDFGVQGFVPFLSNGKVDHRGEHFSREEGIGLFTGEDPSRVRIFPCPERVRVAGAVVSPQ
jgi:hypothetical protein